MQFNTPKEAAIIWGKIILALLGAMVMTGLTIVILPLGDISPATPGRVVIAIVFYASWALLIFKLVVGEFIPISFFKENEI